MKIKLIALRLQNCIARFEIAVLVFKIFFEY